jgi:hypothetical protein
MKFKIILSFLFISTLLVSCSSEKKGDSKSEGGQESDPKAKKERLKELDEEFLKATKVDEKKAKEFVGLCMEYADANPDDKDVPMYLEKGGLVAGAIKKYKLKTDLFQFILDKHRGYPNYTNVIYLQAVAWDTEMKDAVIAKKFYLMVLEQHKDSGIIESAETRLATIDSLSYEQHVDMLIKKAESQLQ